MKQPQILVVDDDPVIVTATRRVLEAAGYEILSAQDGEQALEVTRARRPDLILLDVNLPKMDGFETCRQIKADPALAGIFIIIMTSTRTDSDSQVEGLNLGADGYLARPLANRELLARVAAMLRIQAGERALQVSNSQWSATFDAVSDAILLTDANDTILKCNQAAAEMWQQSRETLVGEKCYQVTHGTETPVSTCPLSAVRETKNRQILTFTQKERWLEAKVDPMFDANGNFSGTVHVIADITERMQAEQKLRESEEKWRSLVENSPDFIALHDAEGKYLFLNHYAEGFSEKDIVGKSLYQFLLPESVELFHEQVEKALKIWKPQHFEHTALGELGAARVYEEDLVPFYGKNQTINLLAVARDITERKQNEEALKESEARFKAQYQYLPLPTYSWKRIGTEFVLVDSNEAAMRITNGQVEKLLGKTASEMYQDTPQILDDFQACFTGQTTIERELQIPMRSTGDVRDFIVQYAFIAPDLVMVYTLDITQRVQAEEKLRESEGKFHQMFDISPVGIVMVGLDKRFIHCNHAFSQSLGYGTEELVGKLIDAVTLPEDNHLGMAEMLAIMKGEITKAQVHKRYIRKDGQIVWGEVTISLIRDSDGCAQYFLAIIQDITARKQAETALRESEDKFKYIFDHSVIGKSITLPSGELNVNQAFCEMLGYTPDELKSRRWQEISHPDDLELTQTEIEALLSGQSESTRFIKRYLHKNGSTVWAEVATALRRDQAGNPLYFLTTINDITGRKQAEDALRESEEKYRAVVDQASDGIMIGQDGVMRFSNFRFASMLGYQVSEVEGNEFSQMIPPENLRFLLERHQKRMAGEPVPAIYETTLLHKSGERIPVEVNASLMQYEGKTADLVMMRDNTERKRAEAALRETQMQLQAIMDYSPALISIKDLKGNVILANRSLAVLDAPPPSELIGRNVSEIFPKEVAEQLWKNDLAALDAKAPVRSEEVVKHKDGVWHTYLTVKFPIYFDSDQPFGICAISNDITERKQFEQILRETSEHLAHMLANSPTVIYALKVKDEQATPSWISANIELILGFKVEDGLRTEWWPEQVHPQDRATALNSLGHLFDDFYQHEYRFLRQDGRIIWLHDEHRLLRDAEGKPCEIIGAWTDITERKQAEETLRASEALSQAILENSPIGVSVRSRTGRLLSANEAWKKIWAMSETDFERNTTQKRKALKFDERDSYLQDYQTEVRRVYEEGGYLHLPSLKLSQPRSGGAQWVAQHFYAIKDAQGQVDRVVILTEDITLSKQAEAALREYNTRLEAEVEVRTRELRETQEKLVRQEKLAVLGQLAGSVGHELRNPLGIINNAIYFLRLIQPEAGEQVKEYLGIIESETRTADKIIGDLLDFSRIKSVDVEPVTVNELVLRTLERYPVPETIQLILNLPNGLPTLYVDPRQVTQVLGNLVQNACQAMHAGGRLTVDGRQLTVDGQSSMVISVKDTGVGITPENMKKLFEPLFTTKPKGIGLGLAVSQKLIEANGGKIEVESEPGEGTTFTVWLPVKA